jgi:hypothetical protein
MFFRSKLLWSCLLFLLGAIPVGAQSPSFDTSPRQKFQSPMDWATLTSSLATNPNDPTLVRQSEAAVESGLPDQLPIIWTEHLPVQTVTLPDNLGLQVTPNIYLPTPAIEPQHGAAFPCVTDFYVPTETAGTDRLLCRLHFMDDGDVSLAGRVGALLTLLHRTQVSRMGAEPAEGAQPFNVWLCRQGPAGEDEWHRNIYFYDLDTPRSSIEWVREIAHEYSHMAMPAIGGYTAPEYWANGYYGERLLVRWLAKTPGDSALVARVWGNFSGWPNFERLLITPVISLYEKTGSNKAMEARTDKKGMDYLIGQILVFDGKYGSRRLADAFSYLPHAREALGPDFGAAESAMLSQQASGR